MYKVAESYKPLIYTKTSSNSSILYSVQLSTIKDFELANDLIKTVFKEGKSDSNLPEVLEERMLAVKPFYWGGSLNPLKNVYIIQILWRKDTGASDYQNSP